MTLFILYSFLHHFLKILFGSVVCILFWLGNHFSSLTAPSTGITDLCDHTWAVLFSDVE